MRLQTVYYTPDTMVEIRLGLGLGYEITDIHRIEGHR